MSTQLDSHPYYHRLSISPPVSPKTLPHGYKRKASTQDDEVENHSHISNSFKKLRLKDGRPSSTAEVNPVTYPCRTAEPPHQPSAESTGNFGSQIHAHAQNEDDYMGIDDTNDRVWIHDLDAEIKEIEAQEARDRDGVQLIQAGRDYSKVPEHILRHNPQAQQPAENLQMVLYRDPVSISVPQEEDAVRKAIIEARQRMREKQQESVTASCRAPDHYPMNHSSSYMNTMLVNAGDDDDDDDGMDID